MKQKITNAEKLYHLLFEVCTSKENRREYGDGAYEAILSVLLIMNDNTYKDIREIVNPNEIRVFLILNQCQGKKIILLAKDIKSSSYRNGELRVNCYKTIVDETANYKYKERLRATLMFEQENEEDSES